jgi:hypothetical protein
MDPDLKYTSPSVTNQEYTTRLQGFYFTQPFFRAVSQAKLSIIWSQFQFLMIDGSMDKIDKSLTLSWPVLDRNIFFIRFRTEKERSPPVFVTGSVRYSYVPATRGAPDHGLDRLCLNPPLLVHTF